MAAALSVISRSCPRASFETLASRAPQDDEVLSTLSTIYVLLRRREAPSRRTQAPPARTAGDGNHLARDEGRLVAAQKGDQVGDVARHAGPAHRDLADDLLFPLLGVAAEPDRYSPRHLGVD